MTELFKETTENTDYREITIGKADHYKTLNREMTGFGYTFKDLAPKKKGKNMEPFIVTVGFKHKTNLKRGGHCHSGEEFLYVLEGKIEFFYNGKSYTLEQGDSAYFDAEKPHWGESVGDKEAELLIVIYSYKRL